MAKPSESSSDSFDLDKFRKLLQLMEKHGVTEANLQKGDESWKVRRGPKQVTVSPEVTVAAPAPTTVPAAAPAPAAPAPAPAAPAPTAGITIDAATVRTFYSAATRKNRQEVNIYFLISQFSNSVPALLEKSWNEMIGGSRRVIERIVER